MWFRKGGGCEEVLVITWLGEEAISSSNHVIRKR